MSTRSSKRVKVEGKVEEVSEAIKEEIVVDKTQKGISEYEKVRLENIRLNNEFLESLGLNNVKSKLEVPKQEKKAATRGSEVRRYSAPVGPTRRSGRVTVEKLKAEIQDAEGDEKELKETLLKEMLLEKAKGSYETVIEQGNDGWGARARIDEANFSLFPAANQPVDPDTDIKLWVDPLLKALSEIDIKKESSGSSSSSSGKKAGAGTIKKEVGVKTSLAEYTLKLSKLRIVEDEVAKLTESRITQVWLHPSTDKLIVAAGDTTGNLGIFDVNNKESGNGGVFKFKPHVSNISKLHSWSTEPSKLYSVSYDGTIRFLDLNKEAFVLGFEAPEGLFDLSFNDASFSNDGHSIFVGRTDGKVGLVDLRSTKQSTYEWCFETQATKINSVQQHPTDSNLLITAGSGAGGIIAIHDIRKAGPSCKPLTTMNEHTKSINAAYCSPNGKYIVSVGQDGTIRTWSNFITPSERAYCAITKHDNHTGRWLSTFRPTFDPKQPASFVLGSMDRPRRIEIFSPSDAYTANPGSSNFSLSLLEAIRDDQLGSVCSRNCFHPTMDIVIGGNSSGRVHIIR
jgi:WD40 repeat protein